MTSTCEEDFNLQKLLTAQDHKLSESGESSDPQNVSENGKFDQELFDSETSPDTSGKPEQISDIPATTPDSQKQPKLLKGYLQPQSQEIKSFGDPEFLKAMQRKYLSQGENGPPDRSQLEKHQKSQSGKVNDLFKSVKRLREQIQEDKENFQNTARSHKREETLPSSSKINSIQTRVESSTEPTSTSSQKNITPDHQLTAQTIRGKHFEADGSRAYSSESARVEMALMGSFQQGGGIPMQTFQIGDGPSGQKRETRTEYWSPKFNSLRNSKSVDSIQKMPRLVEKSKDIVRMEHEKRLISNWSGINNALQRNGYSPIPLISELQQGLAQPFSLKPDCQQVQTTLASLLYEIEKKLVKPQPKPSAPPSSKEIFQLCEEIKRLKLDKARLRDQRNQFEEKYNKEANMRKQQGAHLTNNYSKTQRNVKSLEQKCSRLEKLVKRKEMELEKIQTHLQEKQINETKFTGNAGLMFEKIFGKAPRPSDQKFLKILSSYDQMIEKLQRERNAFEKHNRDLKKHIEELEDKLYILSNGKEMPTYPGNKPTQQFMEKFSRMQQQECRLKHQVLMLKEQNVSLLSQISQEKGQNQSLHNQISLLRQECGQRLTLQESHGLKAELKETKAKLLESMELNSVLQNDLMLLKNETNTHFKERKGSARRIPPLSTRSHRSQNSNPNFDFTLNDSIIQLSVEELRTILKQCMDLLNIRSPGLLPSAVGKMEKVIHAVPRMEKFIKGVCEVALLSPGGDKNTDSSSIELVLPTLCNWRKELNESIDLRALRTELCSILGANPASSSNHSLISHLKRLVSANQIFCQGNSGPQNNQLVNRLAEHFSTNDLKELEGNLEELFIFAKNMRQFLSRMRSFFKLDHSSSVIACLQKIHHFMDDAQNGFNILLEMQGILRVKSIDRLLPTMRHFMQAYKSQCELFAQK